MWGVSLSNHGAQVQVLEGWMAGRQLPVWLKARLREHYLRSWAYETGECGCVGVPAAAYA